jgi:hypothetical protein
MEPIMEKALATQLGHYIAQLDVRVFQGTKAEEYAVIENSDPPNPDQNVELHTSGTGRAAYHIYSRGIIDFLTVFHEGKIHVMLALSDPDYSQHQWVRYTADEAVWNMAALFVRMRIQKELMIGVLTPELTSQFPRLALKTALARKQSLLGPRFDMVMIADMLSYEIRRGKDDIEHLVDVVRMGPSDLAAFEAKVERGE